MKDGEGAMAGEVLLDKRDDRIAVLSLNRPQALNAIDMALIRALREAVRDVEADDAIDLLIMTGAGAKAFSVGVDLKERQKLSDRQAHAFRMGELFPMYRELEQKTKPAIALVRGHCLGGGFEIALCCDMILATPDATFALPEVKWGLIPAAGGCRKLPKLIGMARAKELILTARTVTAADAERLGIVNRVVAAKNGMHEALELARAVLANTQAAVRGAKRCLDHDSDWDGEKTAPFDIKIANLCFAATDRNQGVSNFTARKRPRSQITSNRSKIIKRDRF
ncbi:MAG: enoyl-CoA hydratase/isomerase family protein [Hyphomicrobiales bacterium]|nr:enoyl-CoA hydratase/isomerase family protein [Hyphomicrobiales bacterium]